MKIAITTNGYDLDGRFEECFGRTDRFLIYDTDTKTFEILDNTENCKAAQGVGIQAAQNVVNTGVSSVLTGRCGPKAVLILNKANIEIFTVEANTVRDALEKQRQTITQCGPKK